MSFDWLVKPEKTNQKTCSIRKTPKPTLSYNVYIPLTLKELKGFFQPAL